MLKKFKGKGNQSSPTLSVGIAIGHFMEDLGLLREWGKEAEHIAKGDNRNGLAVVLHTRGGGDFSVRAQWDTKIDKKLPQYIETFQTGKLPHKLPYDLEKLLMRYKSLNQEKFENELIQKQIFSDVKLLLEKKQIDLLKIGLLSLQEELLPTSQSLSYGALKKLNKTLLLASRIASYLPRNKEINHE